MTLFSWRLLQLYPLFVQHTFHISLRSNVFFCTFVNTQSSSLHIYFKGLKCFYKISYLEEKSLRQFQKKYFALHILNAPIVKYCYHYFFAQQKDIPCWYIYSCESAKHLINREDILKSGLTKFIYNFRSIQYKFYVKYSLR